MTRAEAGDAGEPGRSWRRWLALAGTLAVLVGGGLVAARTVDLGAAVDAARTADPFLLGAAVLTCVATWPLRGRRYGDALAPMDRRVGTWFLTAAVVLSQTANLALPARAGDGVRAYVLDRRRDVPYASSVASLTVTRVFDVVVLLAVCGLGLAGLAAVGGPGLDAVAPAVTAATPGWPAAGALGLGAAVLAGVATRPRGRASAARARAALADLLPSRVAGWLRSFWADLGALASSRRALWAVAAGSLAVWTLDVAAGVLVLAAVTGTPVGGVLVVGALAVAVGNLAKAVPLTQGGLGIYEGAFAATVVALSPVAGAVALAAAVLDHALKNGVTLAGGAVAGAVLQVSPRAAATTCEEA